MVYMVFYAPNIRDIVTGTASNVTTSGGFGPNQVSTIMGLGVFASSVQALIFSTLAAAYIAEVLE